MTHPNTLAVGISGLASAGLVYLLNTYAHTHLNAVDGAGIVTGIAGAVIFVGRRGIKRALIGIWAGSDPPTPPPAAPPAAAPPPAGL